MHKIYVVILAYFVITFLVAWYFSRKESLQGYFLNNRSSSLWLLIFSNVATMMGAGAVITTTAATYSSGISFGITIMFSFLCGAIILGLLAKKIVRFGNEHEIYSIVDFFAKRFDRKNQILVFSLQLLLLIIRTAIQIIGITYLINVLTGIDYYLALWISVGIIIFYTAIGGLRIDIITDFVQFRIIIIVFIMMTVIGYHQVGGLHHLIAILPIGNLNPLQFGGLGFLIGTMVFGGLIYIPNTSHRQRILSAKTENIAKKSFFRSIPFLLLIMAMVIFLGLIASVTLSGINPNKAIFLLINELLINKRLTGLGFACILAVIMSSLNSLLIAGSTIIYKGLITAKKTTEKRGLLYARLLTASFGIVCTIIAIYLPDIVTLSLLCSYLTLIFVPAVIAGFYFPKISANASFYSIVIPAIVLLGLYFVAGRNIFIVSTSLAIIIIIFYDKIFKKRRQRSEANLMMPPNTLFLFYKHKQKMTTENGEKEKKELPISIENLEKMTIYLDSINVEIGTTIEITPQIREIIGCYKEEHFLARNIEVLGHNLFKIEFVFPMYNMIKGDLKDDNNHVSIVQMQLAILQGVFLAIGLGIRQNKVNSPMSYETFLLNRGNILYRRDQRTMRKKLKFNERCHLIFKLREPIKKGNIYSLVIDMLKDKSAFLDGWVEGLIQDEYLFDEREKANFKDTREDKTVFPNAMAGNVLTRFEVNQDIKDTINIGNSPDQNIGTEGNITDAAKQTD